MHATYSIILTLLQKYQDSHDNEHEDDMEYRQIVLVVGTYPLHHSEPLPALLRGTELHWFRCVFVQHSDDPL